MSSKISLIIAGACGRMGQAIISTLADLKDETLYLGGALEHAEHAQIGKHVHTYENALVGDPIIESKVARAALNLKNPVLIDFTTPRATLSHVHECLPLGIPMVIGTTGFSMQEYKEIEEFSKRLPVVMSPNFSIGVNLMIKVLGELAAAFPESYDLEVIEAHHRLKKDAPSGTALRLARALCDGRGKYLENVICVHREGNVGERPPGQIGVQSIRGGDIVGDHTVYFAGPGERLEITHRAHNRSNFASGAVRAAKWLWQRGEKVIDLMEPGLYDMFDVLGIKKEGKLT